MTRQRKHIETLVVLTLFLLLLARWRHSWYYAGAGTALLLTGLAWKGFARYVHQGWMKLGEGIGYITGKIILTIVFIVIVLPLSLFARLSGKLGISTKAGSGSYFKERNHLYGKEDLENPW